MSLEFIAGVEPEPEPEPEPKPDPHIIGVTGDHAVTNNFDGDYIKNGQQINGHDIWENNGKGFYIYVFEATWLNKFYWIFSDLSLIHI